MPNYQRFGNIAGSVTAVTLCTSSRALGRVNCLPGNVLPVTDFSAGNLSTNLYNNTNTNGSGFNLGIANTSSQPGIRALTQTLLPPEIRLDDNGNLQVNGSRITSGFDAPRQVASSGPMPSNPHRGMDLNYDNLGQREDRTFESPVNGTVLRAQDGQIIILETGTGLKHIFFHGQDSDGLGAELLKAKAAGQELTVEVGTTLGTVSGYSTSGTQNAYGAHLHYQIADQTGKEITANALGTPVDVIDHWANRELPVHVQSNLQLPDGAGTVEIAVGQINLTTAGGQEFSFDLNATR